MKNKITCQHCKERYVGCHAECVDYIAFREERDYINDLRASENKRCGEIECHTSRKVYRRLKRDGRKCFKK